MQHFAHRVHFIRTINSDFSLNKINWLIFLMERQPNFCAVGTESLYYVLFRWISP